MGITNSEARPQEERASTSAVTRKSHVCNGHIWLDPVWRTMGSTDKIPTSFCISSATEIHCKESKVVLWSCKHTSQGFISKCIKGHDILIHTHIWVCLLLNVCPSQGQEQSFSFHCDFLQTQLSWVYSVYRGHPIVERLLLTFQIYINDCGDT